MKLWGGRFSAQTDDAASHFHSSLSFDKRLYKQDINGSIAHAKMLGRQGIIMSEDAEAIVKALADILAAIENGEITISGPHEDIHSFIEAELISRIGDAGRRLHTGRSRNDQVALDMRMYVKEEADTVKALLGGLMETLLTLAKEHTATVMPGFTHLQKAQPVTLAHHLLAYFQMFKRDYERISDCRKRADFMPLGSGALASTVYPLDREYVKDSLGFAEITANSLDAVSDRDFCLEFVSGLAIIMMHLSRFCEELILWSTDGFGFIEISDAYATGSSIMPQKKNPDMAELIRGKTGRVYGGLMNLLTMMKALPLAYNKDMQEDKEAVFDAADTVKSCLDIFNGMLKNVTFKKDVMYQSSLGGYLNATDAADWLVRKGLPFREAHEITGRLVRLAIDKGVALEALSFADFKNISALFDETVFEAISVEASLNARNIAGGPAGDAVNIAIREAEVFLCRTK